jgi:RNA polymerase sigma factor (sigma-70 family)
MGGHEKRETGNGILATLASPGVSATARSRPDVTDHDLVQAVRAGDDHAFERLYHRYHRRISAYIFGMVHDHGRAEDLTQEVFVSSLRRMRQTDRPIAFKPWIYEIAKNACIDQFRRTSRTEEVSIDADDGAGLAPADHGKLQARGLSPDDAVESKQQLADLQGAFGGLSEAHHQILVMRELEGLSYREIGERLGMSRPSVESTLFRARRRLTEEYEELRTGERCLRIQEIIARASAASTVRLGLRDQRRVGSHISHCQPCRKHAVMAGLDAAGIARRPVRAKIAAFLPLPAFLKKRWLESVGGGDGASPVPVDAAAGHALTQASLAAAQYGDSTMAGWMKATAVAAAVAVAGVGTGAAEHVTGGGAKRHDAPVAHHAAAASTPSGGGAIAAGGATRPASAPATATRAGGTASHSSSAGHAGRAATGTAGGSGSTSSGANHFSGANAPAGNGGGSSSGSSGSGSSSSPQSASSAASKGGASHTTTAATDPVKQAAGAATGAAGAATGAATGGGSSTPAPPLVDPNLGALTQPAATPPPTSVGGVVTQTTDTLGNTVGGAVGDTVKQTGDAVGQTVDKVTDGLGQAVGGLLGGGKTSGQ